MSTYTGQPTYRSLTHTEECEKCEYVWERKRQVLRRKRKRGRNIVEEKRRDDLIHKSSSSRAFLFCSTSPRATRYYDIYIAETGRYNYSRFEIILPFFRTTRSYTDDRLYKPYRSSRISKSRSRSISCRNNNQVLYRMYTCQVCKHM